VFVCLVATLDILKQLKSGREVGDLLCSLKKGKHTDEGKDKHAE
jgi:hypothetical protein